MTASSLWPRSVSWTLSVSVSRQLAGDWPVHDTRTLAVLPDTLAWAADAWPLTRRRRRVGRRTQRPVGADERPEVARHHRPVVDRGPGRRARSAGR